MCQDPGRRGAECTYWAQLRAPVEIGAGPYGARRFFEVTGGELTGERLSGKLLTGGGDWALIGPDGWARLDVRAQIETTDGAGILLTYYGVRPINDVVQQALSAGAGTQYEDHYFRTAPRFETGDSRYGRLNQTVFVSAEHLRPVLVVEYEVFRVNECLGLTAAALRGLCRRGNANPPHSEGTRLHSQPRTQPSPRTPSRRPPFRSAASLGGGVALKGEPCQLHTCRASWVLLRRGCEPGWPCFADASVGLARSRVADTLLMLQGVHQASPTTVLAATVLGRPRGG
ncbi:MAG: DUF3237 domain-containing protein [Actinomycetota bacterium]|nr:DUF3237 domain-containing protein [Actinomycetota bacterium]